MSRTNNSAFVDDKSFDASIPQVRTDALVCHVDNEIVAWSPLAPNPVYLDPVAALGYQMMDGSPVGAIVRDVNEILGVPASIARNQLRRTISLLEAGALLENSRPPAVVPLEVGLFQQPENP